MSIMNAAIRESMLDMMELLHDAMPYLPPHLVEKAIKLADKNTAMFAMAIELSRISNNAKETNKD